MAEKINTTINGLHQTFEVGIDDSAISVIREQAGLKGTKFVCTLDGTAPGSQIEAISPTGVTYDLWFEAGAARKHYRLSASP